jgi:hypothetical protein
LGIGSVFGGPACPSRASGCPACAGLRLGLPCSASFPFTRMPSPLPRRKGEGSALALLLPYSLPCADHQVGFRIMIFEACSAFTHVAACWLAAPSSRNYISGWPTRRRAVAEKESEQESRGLRTCANALRGVWWRRPSDKRRCDPEHSLPNVPWVIFSSDDIPSERIPQRRAPAFPTKACRFPS